MRRYGGATSAWRPATACTFLLVDSNAEELTSSSRVVDDQLAKLRTLITRHAERGASHEIEGVVTTTIDGVLLSAATGPTEPTPSMTGTVMALVAQGAKRLAIGDRVYEYEPGQYLVASVDLPITGHYSGATKAEPALGFGLVLHPSTIASLLLDAAEQAPSGVPWRATGALAPPALGVAEASPELLDAVIRILCLLDTASDRHLLAPMVEREILWRLITGPLGETVRQVGLADSSLTHISHAVRWITEHYSDPFLVEDLARSCGMSTSAFHRNFLAVTGLSPVQFQKQIRLHESRLMLIAGRDDVGTIGYRVGYESASQFSREYRRRFGLPPGRDGARLRAESSPA
jgi:AraC-like DNA-binding protein